MKHFFCALEQAWEYKFSRQQFEQKARLWTEKYATDNRMDVSMYFHVWK